MPEGPFDLGVATGKELNRFYAYGDGGTATPPYTVSGPGPIPTGRQPGRLWATGITPEDGGEIPGSFPNGYRAFYAMRFAITQGQYADFLNSLPEAEAALRYFPEGHGKWIGRSGEPPNRVYAPLGRFPNTWFRPAAPDRDHRCPWLSSADSAAFAAWAGLRPMTELEYEKTCRGPALPVLSDQSGSFWGSRTSISGRCMSGRFRPAVQRAGRSRGVMAGAPRNCLPIGPRIRARRFSAATCSTHANTQAEATSGFQDGSTQWTPMPIENLIRLRSGEAREPHQPGMRLCGR